MAKTSAPLLGFGASGSIADTLVYASWRGVPYARRHVIPSNPQTSAQSETRNIFRTLSQLWKLLPSAAVAPWNAFATGRQFLGVNAYTGQNMRVLRKPTAATDFDLLIGSPGARGGLAPSSIDTAEVTTQITVTLGIPTPPAGWSVTAVHGIAFINQSPQVDFTGSVHYATDDTDPYALVFTGLTDNEEYVLTAWIEYERPDGLPAYSVSLTTTETPLP
jgi:hypothetical protein